MEEARLGNKAELKSPDPIVFWLAQVCINLSFMFVPNFIHDFKETSKEFLTELPTLTQDIMAIPASTSVPSERLFSISGILSENRRSRISPENLENRVRFNNFIIINLHFFNFKLNKFKRLACFPLFIQ